MDYRKIYEENCNIKIPKGYEVHHIDFDRSNNKIMNLVLLPKELHNKYHTLVNRYKSMNYELVIKLQSSIQFGYGINDYIVKENLEIIKEFSNVWYECVKYVDYRNELLGLLPSIHNFEDFK